MAKLSARNRTEIARFKRDFSYVSTLDNRVVNVVEKRAIMSDRNILSNSGHGWKLRGKIRSGVSIEEAVATFEKNEKWTRIVR